MSATIEVMNSYDYCTFKVSLGDEDATSDEQVTTLLVRAQALVTEAVERYRAEKSNQPRQQGAGNGQGSQKATETPQTSQGKRTADPSQAEREMKQVAQAWMDHVAKAKSIGEVDRSEKQALAEPLGEAAHAQIRQVAAELRKKLAPPVNGDPQKEAQDLAYWTAKLNAEKNLDLGIDRLNGAIMDEWRKIKGADPIRDPAWNLMCDVAERYGYFFPHHGKQFIPKE